MYNGGRAASEGTFAASTDKQSGGTTGNRRWTGRKVGPKTGNAPFSRQERGMARSHGGKTGGQAGGEGRVMRSLEARMRRPSFGINKGQIWGVCTVEGQGGERGDGWRIVGPMGTTTGEYRALPNKMARRSAWGRSGREGREGEGRDCLDNGGAQTSGGRLRIPGGERGRDGRTNGPGSPATHPLAATVPA
jgi:hypothetical protein